MFFVYYTGRPLFLQVYSNTLSEEGHVSTYCGSSPPSTLSTNSNIMYILYNNVGSIANTVFKAHYWALCEVYLLGSSGYFSSLDTDNTGRGQNCTWVIAANSSQIIRIEIEGMYDGVWSKQYKFCTQYKQVCYQSISDCLKCWIVLLLYSAVCTFAFLILIKSYFYILIHEYVLGNDTPVSK